MLPHHHADSDPALPDFLPGRLRFDAGDVRDYRQLARFHYRAGKPATWCRTLVIRYSDRPRFAYRDPGPDRPDAPAAAARPLPGNAHDRPVAIAVLSWPTAVNRARSRIFGLAGLSYRDRIRFANDHLRTISRVIVHPQFRGMGLAVLLVRRLIDRCPTRFVEASAVMGEMHPMFLRAGMLDEATPQSWTLSDPKHRIGGASPPADGSGWCHESAAPKPAYFWLDRTPHLPWPTAAGV